MVERSLSMREVRGSIPRISINPPLFPQQFLCHEFNATCHTSIRLIRSPRSQSLPNSVTATASSIGPCTWDPQKMSQDSPTPIIFLMPIVIDRVSGYHLSTHKSTCVVSSCLVHSFIVKNRDFFFLINKNRDFWLRVSEGDSFILKTRTKKKKKNPNKIIETQKLNSLKYEFFKDSEEIAGGVSSPS